MEIKKIDEELRAKLRVPLPAEAISVHPTKTFLSAIKAIYVEERLNDVFGVGSWRTKSEHIISEKAQKADKNGNFPIMVVCKLIFEIQEYGVYHECYGGNDNADLGDAFKGATTDAITKIGSYLEIGIDVFKGKSTASHQKPQNASTDVLQSNTTDKPWITDEAFKNAIKELFSRDLIKIGDDQYTVLNLLRKRYKVAKKYGDMVEPEINNQIIK